MAIAEAPKFGWSAKQPVLDPSKPRGPQIAALAAQLFGLLGGPVFGLIGMLCYPILVPDRVLAIGGLAIIMLWFAAAAFLALHRQYFPTDMSIQTRIMLCFGVAVCATGWTIGCLDIGNGYAMPVISKEVPVAYKRASRDRDPHRRSYYVGARLWSSPRNIVEITVPRALFDRLDVPDTDLQTPRPDFSALPNHGHIRLLVGRGRFGIAWLHGVAQWQPDALQRDNRG